MKKVKINIKRPIKCWKGWSKKKKIITSATAVVLVCAVTVTLVFANQNDNSQMQSAVQTAEVIKGNISNTIVGTGNLEADNSNGITVPSGITIKKVKVESGDAVSKGDTLATVDTTSVLSAIETVQEEIEGIDDEINECRNSDETESITAKISGVVKKIYAKEGESVEDCIAENGALLVIAVDSDSDEELEITASGGTVSKIHVSKKDEVSSGDTLLTITKDEESTEYKQLIAKRKALTESLQKLTSMAKTGKIVADMDGTIGEVNITDGSESSTGTTSTGSSTGNSSNNKGSSANQMSYTKGNISAQTLKTTRVAQTTAQTLATTRNVSTSVTTLSSNDAEAKAQSTDEKIKLNIVNSGNSTNSNMVLSAPETGNTPQSKIDDSTGSYEGKVAWSPANSTFAAGTTYSADVTLTAKDGYVFGIDSILSVQTGILSGTMVSDDGKTLTFHITFPATAEEQTQKTQDTTTSSQKNDSGKEKETTVTGNKSGEGDRNTNTTDNSNTAKNNSTFGNSDTGSTSQTGSSATGKSTSLSSTQSAEEADSTTDSESSSYSNEVTAFTLASNDSMILSVNVDELDINSVSKGQEVNITLDAIENQTFTGTVTKVGNSASSSSGGVAKYTVEVTIAKDEKMKAGMNASATIVIENKENILTIPVNALQERRDSTFVYTKKDDDGNLSGEVEVTTGLSDGDNVEITEGLSEGDTVYYQRTGKISNQSSGKMSERGNGQRGERGNMSGGFGGKGGSDGMPSGGMPAGGPGGNE